MVVKTIVAACALLAALGGVMAPAAWAAKVAQVPQPGQAGQGAQGGRAAPGPQEVSIIELLANPARFDGKQIRVTGYLVREFEGDAIYLHRDDYDHAIFRNGLWTTFARDESEQRCKSRRYASVEGKFSARNRGHLGAWGGAIENIARCRVSR